MAWRHPPSRSRASSHGVSVEAMGFWHLPDASGRLYPVDANGEKWTMRRKDLSGSIHRRPRD
eukprot:2527891-Alexandrium_andersonii.AAC.1